MCEQNITRSSNEKEQGLFSGYWQLSGGSSVWS